MLEHGMMRTAAPTGASVDFFGDGSGVSLWKLDANGSDTSATYNGTGVNMTFAAGKFGTAMSSGYVNLGTAVTNYLKAGPFTISIWCKTASDITTDQKLWMSDANNVVQISLNSSVFQQYIYNSGVYIIYSGTVQANTWYHLVWTHSATHVNTFYVSNVAMTPTTTRALSTATTYSSIIGANTGGTSQFLGLTDHVRMFNKAVSASEVTQLFNEI